MQRTWKSGIARGYRKPSGLEPGALTHRPLAEGSPTSCFSSWNLVSFLYDSNTNINFQVCSSKQSKTKSQVPYNHSDSYQFATEKLFSLSAFSVSEKNPTHSCWQAGSGVTDWTMKWKLWAQLLRLHTVHTKGPLPAGSQGSKVTTLPSRDFRAPGWVLWRSQAGPSLGWRPGEVSQGVWQVSTGSQDKKELSQMRKKELARGSGGQGKEAVFGRVWDVQTGILRPEVACRVGLAVETISRVPGDETKDGQSNQRASPAY